MIIARMLAIGAVAVMAAVSAPAMAKSQAYQPLTPALAAKMEAAFGPMPDPGAFSFGPGDKNFRVLMGGKVVAIVHRRPHDYIVQTCNRAMKLVYACSWDAADSPNGAAYAQIIVDENMSAAMTHKVVRHELAERVLHWRH